MKRWLHKLSLAAGFSLAALTFDSTATAQDEKKPEMKKEAEKKGVDPKETEKKPEKPAKPFDWSKFPKHSEASGELVKITETAITLRNVVPERQGPYIRMKNIDVEYTWHEQGVARRDKAPKFTNDKGLDRPGTPDELQKLRKPIGVPGFAMDRSELKTGDLIKVELVRPTAIPPSKIKPEDLMIKYAFMMGENPKPTKPLDPGEPKKKN
ncbi:hypothetical protein BH11PLA2_BH11PLA2_43060 [soil metagenome]